MFTLRTRKGQPRPVELDLPPTLTPNPICSQAPVASRAASLAISCMVYGAFATGGLLLARTTVVDHRGPRTCGNEVVLDLNDVVPQPPKVIMPPPPETRPEAPSQLTRPEAWKAPDTTNMVPETPTTVPTRDASRDGLFTQDMPVDKDGQGTQDVQALLRNAAKSQIQNMSNTTTVVDISFSSLRVLHQAPVVYPRLAMMAKVQGPVVLQITVDAQGKPSIVEVKSGPMQLQAEAMRCAREWRFEPATSNGQPVSARFNLTIVFKLA